MSPPNLTACFPCVQVRPSMYWKVFSRRNIGSDRLWPMPVKLAGEKIGITRLLRVGVGVGHTQLIAKRPAYHRAFGDVIQQKAGEAHAKVVYEGWREDVHVVGHGVLIGGKGSAGEGVFISQLDRARNAGDLNSRERIGCDGRCPLEGPACEEV